MNNSQLYLLQNGQQRGPVSFQQLQGLATAGELRVGDLVWQAGMPSWIRADNLPGLMLPPSPPSPPPPPAAMPAAAEQEMAGGMHVVSGYATNIHRSVEAWGNQYEAGTTQVLTFLIGSQSVEVSMPSVPHISEGDEVCVAGDIHNGTLKARAYMNRTNGTCGRWQGSSSTCWNYLPVLMFGFFLPFIFLALPFLLFFCAKDVANMMKNRRALRLVSA